MSGNIRDSLRRRIDGSVSRTGSVQVRYTGFKEGHHEQEGIRTKAPRRRTNGLIGPSGTHYEFRQVGGGTKSQWITVHNQEDMEAFEESDEYEVRRE